MIINKLKFFVIVVFLICGCKNNSNLLKNNNEELIVKEDIKEDTLCKLLLKLYYDDQKYRGLMKDPFFAVLDSIKKSEGISQDEYNNFVKEKQLSYGKKARAIADRIQPEFNEEQIDSLMHLQIKIDNVNTRQYIEIIKKRGYPSKKTCNCQNTAGVVLRHAPQEHFEELKELLKSEYFKGNISDVSYLYQLNHFHYREDITITNMRLDSIKQKIN